MDPRVILAKNPGLLSRLTNPAFTGALVAMGQQLGQPRGVGQTGWGQAAQAAGAGYNALAMARALQQQREMAAEQQQYERGRQATADVQTAAKSKSDLETAAVTRTATEKGWQHQERMAGLNEETFKWKKIMDLSDENLRSDAALDQNIRWKEQRQIYLDQLALDKEKLAQTVAAEGNTAKYRQDELDLKKRELKIKELDGYADRALKGAQTAAVKEGRSPSGAGGGKAEAASLRMSRIYNMAKAASEAAFMSDPEPVKPGEKPKPPKRFADFIAEAEAKVDALDGKGPAVPVTPPPPATGTPPPATAISFPSAAGTIKPPPGLQPKMISREEYRNLALQYQADPKYKDLAPEVVEELLRKDLSTARVTVEANPLDNRIEANSKAQSWQQRSQEKAAKAKKDVGKPDLNIRPWGSK